MARDWEAGFDAWGNPPSQAEDDQRKRTEEEIREALSAYRPLEDKLTSVYGKGSHSRGTNVRQGSDVDIAIELLGTRATGKSFITRKYFAASSMTNEELGLRDVHTGYPVDDLKRDVYKALVTAYGEAAVTWSNKCLKVREKATTLPADVVPCRAHRRYDSKTNLFEGIEIHPDRGDTIVNWPKQDQMNGTTKNKLTNLRYKRAVRGIKGLENEMADKKIISEVPSFMLECCVFNAPDTAFNNESNFANCLNVMQVWAGVLSAGTGWEKWLEINKLKYVFGPAQSWTIDDLERFLGPAITYLRQGQ